MAKEIHSCLFDPELKGSVINTTEVPVAGRVNAAIAAPLLLDTVNVCIGQNEKGTKEVDGSGTVKSLGKTKQIIYRICSRSSKEDSSSLSLHPFVYFYSDSGNHLPSAFQAVVRLMHQMEMENKFVQFSVVRRHFEEFLIAHKDYIQQVHRNARGQMKGVDAIKEYFLFLINQLTVFQGDDPIPYLIEKLKKSDLSYLKLPTEAKNASKKHTFPPSIKNAAFIAQKLKEATPCRICKARMPDYGMSHDHIEKSELGGPSTLANHGFAHRFCNTAREEILAAMEKHARKAVAR